MSAGGEVELRSKWVGGYGRSVAAGGGGREERSLAVAMGAGFEMCEAGSS